MINDIFRKMLTFLLTTADKFKLDCIIKLSHCKSRSGVRQVTIANVISNISTGDVGTERFLLGQGFEIGAPSVDEWRILQGDVQGRSSSRSWVFGWPFVATIRVNIDLLPPSANSSLQWVPNSTFLSSLFNFWKFQASPPCFTNRNALLSWCIFTVESRVRCTTWSPRKTN